MWWARCCSSLLFEYYTLPLAFNKTYLFINCVPPGLMMTMGGTAQFRQRSLWMCRSSSCLPWRAFHRSVWRTWAQRKQRQVDHIHKREEEQSVCLMSVVSPFVFCFTAVFSDFGVRARGPSHFGLEGRKTVNFELSFWVRKWRVERRYRSRGISHLVGQLVLGTGPWSILFMEK